jgi:hypothetical protein
MTRIAPHLALTIALAAGCSGGDGTSRDAAVDSSPDAPYQAPTLTSFVPTPSSVVAGVPTMITWNWTFQVEPAIPMAVCTISNGVGEVARGAMTMVTLTETTSFRLSCSNAAGMTARDTVIIIPPAAPTLATFTITPASVSPNTPTNAAFAWTFTGTPSPVPTCSVDGGVTVTTSGTQASLDLPQARTYRLRCTNSQGTSFRDVTVAVNECGTASAQCNPNATCTDTLNSYTCACNGNYAGDGDTCNALVGACGSCDPNATCFNANECRCNVGYVGPGTSCTKQRIMFTTSVQGTGNLSTWTDAGGMTGLAAADAICTARGAALTTAGAGQFVAWMSSDTDDAYCRVHGLGGKKSAMCGQGALPVAAGPWIRPPLSTAAGRPVAPTIDRLLAPTLATYYSMGFTETGAELTGISSERVLTGTDDNGVATANNCTNWTSGSFSVRGSAGLAHGGGTTWTDDTAAATDPLCDTTTFRLRCVESVAGPALPTRHPTSVKRVFLTSVSGNGQLTGWPDAAGVAVNATGMVAADEICKTRARYAGYSNATAFKAWLTGYPTSITSRIINSGTLNYTRPDGVVIALNRNDLYTDLKIAAAWYQTETNQYISGTTETGNVWTGLTSSGSYSNSQCGPTFSSTTVWLTGTNAQIGTFGRHDLLDSRYMSFTTQACDQTARLYCIED